LSVAASWAVAFDRLGADNPAALQLLTLVAWLGPEPVPLTLITEHIARLPAQLAQTAADPLALADHMTLLRRRGMARVAPGSIELHRVPAALLRARTDHHDSDIGGWAAMVVQLLRAAVPGEAWNNPAIWPTWRTLLPHVLAVTEPTRAVGEVIAEVSWLLRSAGRYVRSRGEPRGARPLTERAYQLDHDRLDADDPAMLVTSLDLTIVLGALGEHEQARALDEDTLTRRRRVLGEDHPNTLRSAHNLAIRLETLGEQRLAAEVREWTARRHQGSEERGWQALSRDPGCCAR
jgi:hypothetical protein